MINAATRQSVNKNLSDTCFWLEQTEYPSSPISPLSKQVLNSAGERQVGLLYRKKDIEVLLACAFGRRYAYFEWSFRPDIDGRYETRYNPEGKKYDGVFIFSCKILLNVVFNLHYS